MNIEFFNVGLCFSYSQMNISTYSLQHPKVSHEIYWKNFCGDYVYKNSLVSHVYEILSILQEFNIICLKVGQFDLCILDCVNTYVFIFLSFIKFGIFFFVQVISVLNFPMHIFIDLTQCVC